MSHTINDVLRMAGQLLLRHPTTGAMARDTKGRVVEFDAPDACCFCVLGALGASATALGYKYVHARDEYFSRGFKGACNWDTVDGMTRLGEARDLAEIKEP